LINYQLFVLSYVGIGTSIGHPFDIPILLRSLAVGLAILDEDDLPMSFDIDFLTTLDTNLAEQNSLCKIVQKYECAWWKERKARSLEGTVIFDLSSVDICLETHFAQTIGRHSDNLQGSPTTSTSSARPTTSMIPAPDQMGSHTQGIATTQADQSCGKCLEYGNILSNTLLDIVNIHTFANKMLSTSETQWTIDMHRASIFHSLHQAAVIKETSGISSGTRGMSTGIDSVRTTAEGELERLKNLPPSSYKWTWGETLTKSEVLALHRPGTKQNKKMHSGYDVPLKDGKREFEDTPLPSMPETWKEEDGAMADDVQVPPEIRAGEIFKLEQMRSRVYDPLGKRRAARIFPYDRDTEPKDPYRYNLTPRISATLTQENLLLLDAEETSVDDRFRGGHAVDRPDEVGLSALLPPDERVVDTSIPEGLEDIWESASDICLNDRPPDDRNLDTTIPDGVEDIWESDSDKNGQTGIPDVGQPRSIIENLPDTPIEDMWSSGSPADDDDPPPVFEETPTTPLEDIWSTDSQIAENDQPTEIEDEWPLGSEKNESASDTGDVYAPTPGPSSYRHYEPDDFSYLQDDMFEDKLSDSESSEEDY
jgi:hypothetical protein